MRKTSASSAENPVLSGKATACCSCPRSQAVRKAASFLFREVLRIYPDHRQAFDSGNILEGGFVLSCDGGRSASMRKASCILSLLSLAVLATPPLTAQSKKV